MDSKPRYEFIDLAKGICIILVVISHICQGTGVEKLDIALLSFRMPLYFILSGMFFSCYSGIIEFVVKKINRLVVPFFSFYILTSLLLNFERIILGGGGIDICKYLEIIDDGITYNGPLWFLIALFECGLIFYLIVLASKFAGHKKNQIFLIIALSISIGIVGFSLGQNDMDLPFWCDSAMTALPFYSFGYLIRKNTPFLSYVKFKSYYIPLAVIFFILIYFTSSRAGLWSNNMKETSICSFYLCGIIGSMAVLLLSKRIKKIPLISYFGRYSICILVTHVLLDTLSFYLIRECAMRYLHFSRHLASYVEVFVMFASYLLIIPFMIKFLPHICAQKDVFKYKPHDVKPNGV